MGYLVEFWSRLGIWTEYHIIFNINWCRRALTHLKAVMQFLCPTLKLWNRRYIVLHRSVGQSVDQAMSTPVFLKVAKLGVVLPLQSRFLVMCSKVKVKLRVFENMLSAQYLLFPCLIWLISGPWVGDFDVSEPEDFSVHIRVYAQGNSHYLAGERGWKIIGGLKKIMFFNWGVKIVVMNLLGGSFSFPPKNMDKNI